MQNIRMKSRRSRTNSPPKIGILPEKLYMVTAYKSAVSAKKRVKVGNKKQADVGRDVNIGVPANVASPGAFPPDASFEAPGFPNNLRTIF